LRCFHVFIALTLLLTTPAIAAVPAAVEITCYPRTATLRTLLTSGYFPVAIMEVGELPGIIFAHGKTLEYVVFVLNGETICQVGGGSGFQLIIRKKV
jgi:hypothetical protein